MKVPVTGGSRGNFKESSRSAKKVDAGELLLDNCNECPAQMAQETSRLSRLQAKAVLANDMLAAVELAQTKPLG